MIAGSESKPTKKIKNTFYKGDFTDARTPSAVPAGVRFSIDDFNKKIQLEIELCQTITFRQSWPL